MSILISMTCFAFAGLVAYRVGIAYSRGAGYVEGYECGYAVGRSKGYGEGWCDAPEADLRMDYEQEAGVN